MKYRVKTEIITNYLQEHKLSKTAFCKLCGVSLSSLNKLLANNYNMRGTTFVKIVKRLGVKFEDMFEG